ncbi:nuclear envelope integral membrane protein 1-like [Diadema setosum]|uniref:nuclear envelope integral membrane protein 1-like n=1 Tax=Diadema setosum TaxID=31175 RepID=UPI003B3A3768
MFTRLLVFTSALVVCRSTAGHTDCKESFPVWGKQLIVNKAGLHIYCHCGSQGWQGLKILSSVTVALNPRDPDETLLIYTGHNASKVEEASKSAGPFKQLQFLSPWASTRQRLSPFKETCIGVETKNGFEFVTNQRNIDLLYLSLLFAGIILYFISPALSRNYVFHYSSGVFIGVLASLLVLVYVLSKFIPQRSGALAVLAGGWALVGFFFCWIVDNFLTVRYKRYIVGYVILASLVSFVVCYCYGPITSRRTENLLRWGLRLAGLVCIYNCSHLEGASIAIITLLLVYVWIPSGSIDGLRNFSIWMSRPQPRLLSVEEYEEQGKEETRQALDELRRYCSSPECNAWREVTRLESPKRFASFVSGDGHISQDELDLYISDMSLITEDDVMTSDDSSHITDDEVDVEVNVDNVEDTRM